MAKKNHDSAKNLLTTKVPTAFEEQSVAEVQHQLQEHSKEYISINYIYVLGSDRRLKGVISIKDIFRSPNEKTLQKIAQTNIVAVGPHTDQEEAAYLALKNNIMSIPVVTRTGKFLGVIPSTKILKTLYTETTENTMKLGGVTHASTFDDIMSLSIFKSLKHRLPWLIIGLIGGMLASGIVESFESTLSKNIILAAFIPLIVYMADAVGTQMEAFIIRDLAVHPGLNFIKYFLHQSLVVVTTGVIIGILTFGGTAIVYGDIQIALIIALALFCAILTSLMSGLIVPYLFSKIKMDPANASGPVATIIQDLLSVAVYFAIASYLL